MLTSAVRRRSVVAESDDAVAREAAAGSIEAFGELYRRHAGAAWGVAQAIVRNPDDASDAVAEAFTKVLKAVVGGLGEGDETLRFRPYLLTATRHAAIDLVRRQARMEPAEAIADTVSPGRHGHPVDQVLAREEEATVVEAFGRLPERWRTALWLIDVEQLSTRDAAGVLGVEPNNAAQLAVRGRARLREQFLQAHVPNHIRPVCGDVVKSLGSYLAGTASATRRAEVEDHVAACGECAERLAHVRDLGLALRRAILPVPLLLDRRIFRSLSGGLESASSFVQGPAASVVTVGGRVPLDTWTSVVEHLSAASPAVERLVAGVTTAAFVVGMSTAAVKTHEGTNNLQDRAAVSSGSQGTGTGLLPPGFPALVSASTGMSGADGPAVRAGTGVPSVPPGDLAATAASGSNGSNPLALPGAADLLAPASQLVGPTLRGANLAGADLSKVVVQGADLTGANLSGATMTGIDLSRALLSGADLSRASAPSALLRGTDLTRAALPGVNLSGADLTKVLAPGANLTGADLSGAVVRQATFAGADLTRAVLGGADLRGADLRSAKLAGTDLSGADLSGANLAGADLTSANVEGVKLTGATLVGAVLTETGLEQAGGAVSAPASVLPGVPQLPVSVPTTLPATAALLPGPISGVPLPPGATAPGPQLTPSPLPVVGAEPLNATAGLAEPLAATPPLGAALPSTPVPAPLVEDRSYRDWVGF